LPEVVRIAGIIHRAFVVAEEEQQPFAHRFFQHFPAMKVSSNRKHNRHFLILKPANLHKIFEMGKSF
jgi:hypothetical protein